MSRDKQIEEIVKDFCPLYQEYGSCKRCNKDLDIDEEPCYYGCVANLIIDYGYRKASDVAEEIFADLDKALGELAMKYSDEGFNEYFGVCEEIFTKVIYPIKKKYTERSENGK